MYSGFRDFGLAISTIPLVLSQNQSYINDKDFKVYVLLIMQSAENFYVVDGLQIAHDDETEKNLEILTSANKKTTISINNYFFDSEGYSKTCGLDSQICINAFTSAASKMVESYKKKNYK